MSSQPTAISTNEQQFVGWVVHKYRAICQPIQALVRNHRQQEVDRIVAVCHIQAIDTGEFIKVNIGCRKLGNFLLIYLKNFFIQKSWLVGGEAGSLASKKVVTPFLLPHPSKALQSGSPELDVSIHEFIVLLSISPISWLFQIKSKIWNKDITQSLFCVLFASQTKHGGWWTGVGPN